MPLRVHDSQFLARKHFHISEVIPQTSGWVLREQFLVEAGGDGVKKHQEKEAPSPVSGIVTG
jgi:hypothetical protein